MTAPEPCLSDEERAERIIFELRRSWETAEFWDSRAALAEALRSVREEARSAALEEAAQTAQRYFTGMFTGWKGYTSESEITLDEAESAAQECGPICAEAIRALQGTAPSQPALSDDELAATDPNVCEHGWPETYPQPCPECGTAPSQEERGWRPIEMAPTDGTPVWVYVAAYDGLPEFQCVCAYHPDAGWCADELRTITHWQPLPAPPAPSTMERKE